VDGKTWSTAGTSCVYELIGGLEYEPGDVTTDEWASYAPPNGSPPCLSRGLYIVWTEYRAFDMGTVDINEGVRWRNPGKYRSGNILMEIGINTEQALPWWDKYTYRVEAGLTYGWNCCPKSKDPRQDFAIDGNGVIIT